MILFVICNEIRSVYISLLALAELLEKAIEREREREKDNLII